MLAAIKLLLGFLVSLLKSRARLEAENSALRHQLNVLRRRTPKRLPLSDADRLLFVWLYHLCPLVLNAMVIIKPETIIHWHRGGFRAYWRWTSRSVGGRPRIDADLRRLIRKMSQDNPLWGAPRIHGELLKLGFEIGQ
jgi:hypothetical protein